jgi:hypothetical protein
MGFTLVKIYLSIENSGVNAATERLMDLAEAHIRNAGYGGFSFRDLAAEDRHQERERASPFTYQGHDGCCPAVRRPVPYRSCAAAE